MEAIQIKHGVLKASGETYANSGCIREGTELFLQKRDRKSVV